MPRNYPDMPGDFNSRQVQLIICCRLVSFTRRRARIRGSSTSMLLPMIPATIGRKRPRMR